MDQLPPPPPEAQGSSPPFWKRWWFWVIVLVVILIAAGVGSSETSDTEAEGGSPSPVTSATQPPIPSPVETALVPDVVGKSVDDATAELEDAGFVVRVETMVTNLARTGTVMLTAPFPGSSVEVGDTVTLTVAQPFPKIPNVVGKTLANAKRALKNAGFEVGRVTQQTSSKAKGTVISQSPSGGTPARPGRTVSLVTAKPAPEPTSNCTPGYSPCLVYHGGADYDCYGGTGDGPYYTKPGSYTVTGPDPYGLDADNNGVGCE
jgi:resuscitation-promoting factor RpfB